MSEVGPLLSALRQSADPKVVQRIELPVESGTDRDLSRINPLAFAAANGLDEEPTIGAFLHAARLGLFEMSWNVLCPGCGGVLNASATLKSVDRDEYSCARARRGTSQHSMRWWRSPSQ